MPPLARSTYIDGFNSQSPQSRDHWRPDEPTASRHDYPVQCPNFHSELNGKCSSFFRVSECQMAAEPDLDVRDDAPDTTAHWWQ